MSRLFNAVMFFALGCYGANAQNTRLGYNSKPGQPSSVDGGNTSIVELIANPLKYDNKRVRIIGFVRLEFEGNAIYLHREDFLHGISENSVWVNVPKAITKEQMTEVNEKYVICEGVFHASSHGHMGMFSGELSDINRLEPWGFLRDNDKKTGPPVE
jgi:hypothetical protein